MTTYVPGCYGQWGEGAEYLHKEHTFFFLTFVRSRCFEQNMATCVIFYFQFDFFRFHRFASSRDVALISHMWFSQLVLFSSLQDQFDNLEKHTQWGIEYLEKYTKFVKERSEIEINYAKQIRWALPMHCGTFSGLCGVLGWHWGETAFHPGRFNDPRPGRIWPTNVSLKRATESSPARCAADFWPPSGG